MVSFCIQSARSSDDPVNEVVFLNGPGSIIKRIFNMASTSTRNYSAGRSVLRNCFRISTISAWPVETRRTRFRWAPVNQCEPMWTDRYGRRNGADAVYGRVTEVSSVFFGPLEKTNYKIHQELVSFRVRCWKMKTNIFGSVNRKRCVNDDKTHLPRVDKSPDVLTDFSREGGGRVGWCREKKLISITLPRLPIVVAFVRSVSLIRLDSATRRTTTIHHRFIVFLDVQRTQ